MLNVAERPVTADNTPSRRVRLRTEAVRLTCPEGKPHYYFADEEPSNLELKVSKTGRNTWRWRRGSRAVNLGLFSPTGQGGLAYEEARRKADDLSYGQSIGQDPAAVAMAPGAVTTVKSLFDAYRERKVRDASRTRKKNESEASLVSQTKPLIEQWGHLPIVDLNRTIIMQVVRETHLTGDRSEWRVESARSLVSWVRSAWNWGTRNDGLVPTVDRLRRPLLNPAEKLIEDERDLRKAKLPKGKRRGYTVDMDDEEVVALMRGFAEARAAWKPGRKRRAMDLHALRNPSGFLICEFCLYTGCRKSEAVWLHQSDIAGEMATVVDNTAPVPDLHADRHGPAAAELDEHKTDRDGATREIFLGAEARRILRLAAEWRRSIRYTGPLVFPSPNGKPCSTVNHSLDTACGMARPFGLKRRIVVHSLRGAYINYAIRAGVPIEAVSRNVGHSDVSITEQYYRDVNRRLRAAENEKVNEAFGALRQRFEAEVPLPPPTTPGDVVPLRANG